MVIAGSYSYFVKTSDGVVNISYKYALLKNIRGLKVGKKTFCEKFGGREDFNVAPKMSPQVWGQYLSIIFKNKMPVLYLQKRIVLAKFKENRYKSATTKTQNIKFRIVVDGV